jgi:hypothetical protein
VTYRTSELPTHVSWLIQGIGERTMERHSTEIFSPFGSGYVAEAHGSGNLGCEPKACSAAKWIAVVGVLLLGATTAGAVAASKQTQPSIPKLWLQPKPAMLMNLADVGRVEPNLF